MSNQQLEPVFVLDEDIELDYYHPGNHQFMQDLESIKRAVVAHASQMKPWHVQAVRRRMAGASNIMIAEEFEKTPGAVSVALNSPDAKYLRKLLQHHDTALTGPNIALKKRMLYEMALDNQDRDPKVTISAIQELNKMDGHYHKDDDLNTGSNTIIINNNLFPRGKLDGG